MEPPKTRSFSGLLSATATPVAGMTTEPPIRVLIADDDAPVRAGLLMILGGSAEIEVVSEAVDGRTGSTPPVTFDRTSS